MSFLPTELIGSFPHLSEKILYMHTVISYSPSQVNGFTAHPSHKFFNYGWIKNETEKSLYAGRGHGGLLLRFGLCPGRAVPFASPGQAVRPSGQACGRPGAESGGKVESSKLAAELKQKLQAAKAGKAKAVASKAAASSAPVDTVVDALQKPGEKHLQGAAIAAFAPCSRPWISTPCTT